MSGKTRRPLPVARGELRRSADPSSHRNPFSEESLGSPANPPTLKHGTAAYALRVAGSAMAPADVERNLSEWMRHGHFENAPRTAEGLMVQAVRAAQDVKEGQALLVRVAAGGVRGALVDFWSSAGALASIQQQRRYNGGLPKENTPENLEAARLRLVEAQQKLRVAQRERVEMTDPADLAIIAAFNSRGGDGTFDSDLLYKNTFYDFRGMPNDPRTALSRLRRGAADALEGKRVRDFSASPTINHRGLAGYAHEFGGAQSPLLPKLLSLEPGQLWLDVASGHDSAANELLRLRQYKGDFIGVDPGTLPQFRRDWAYPMESAELERRFRHIALPIEDVDLGGRKAAVVTNVMGDIAYDKDFVGALQRSLNHVELGGLLFVSVHQQTTAIVRPDGRAETPAEWLSRQPGVEVERAGPSFIVKKLTESPVLEPLTLVGFLEEKPSIRIYRSES